MIDYEAAWHELHAHIAGKSQHGREPTLVEMAQIVERNRIEVGELPRLLRLYSVETARAEQARTHTVEADGLDAGLVSAADRALADPHRPQGGHDGRLTAGRNGST